MGFKVVSTVGLQRWGALVSLALNLVLLAWLSRPSPDRGPLSGGIKAPASSALNLAAPQTNYELPSPAPASAGATVNPGFHWSQVESGDYRQYIANLRAVGCPGQTIRDIIVADLNQLYSARVQAIWKPRKRSYWQKFENDNPTPDQIKQLMALDKEKAGIVQELLDFKPSPQALIDTVRRSSRRCSI